MKKIAQGTIAISCALAMGMGAFSLAGCSSQTDSSASDNAQATASASQESYTFTDDRSRSNKCQRAWVLASAIRAWARRRVLRYESRGQSPKRAARTQRSVEQLRRS